MEKRGEFQPAAPIAEKQSRSIGLVLAVVFLALCTLVLGGLYCYEKFIAKDNNTAMGDTGPKADCASTEEAEKIDGIEKSEILGVATADTDLEVRNLIKDVEKNWVKKTNQYGVNRVYGEGGPLLKLESGNWANSSKYYGAIISDWEELGDEAILDVLTKNKIVRKDDYYANARQDYYVSDNIVCSLYNTKVSHTQYVLSCANKEWISDEDETLANALIAAYNEKADTDVDYVFEANAEKIETKDGGYQTIRVSFEDSAALFYRKSAESEWEYFKSTQGVMPCADYDSEDLRAAYKGDSCYDGEELTTVK